MHHPLTGGIHDSKHVPKADILNTGRKLIRVENKEIASLVNIYHN